ncbi:phosphoesterase [Frondihabitans sp. PAMC 28766]|uniref:metallophosphoesterase family protein n=1 Tax=Frondihabitans sp. PAMC 28766 TaxID=1795630 RepID=UPI00078D04B4|nr:metallophosphoesterase family protein [Frondihabitans sp. PAMC 28766]AMM19595.1 phosphoesterase [Frondihabitans sp. PAMC 28766]
MPQPGAGFASVAVLSDIHGVLPALDRVLAEPAVQRADVIVVTGDHTWGPQPTGVLDRLVSLGERVLLVRGNADRELLQMSEGQDVGLADDPLSVWGAAQLTSRHRELLRAMPTRVTLEILGFGPALFCHATPRDDAEVVLVDSRPERWADVFADLPVEVGTVVCGHTHMPFVREVDGRLVVNPGSVGLPYGRPGGHWAVLEAGAVTLGCTPLDVDEVIREVLASSTFPGATAWLDEALRTPAGDFEALAEFGPRDGRLSP